MTNAPVGSTEHLAATHAAAALARSAQVKASNLLAQMSTGDILTFANVTRPDERTRWQRLKDFVLRRPAPKPTLQRFQITGLIGASINIKRPTPFKADQKDRYL